MNSGIYQIRNLANEHKYIGSSKSMSLRKAVHFNNLRKGKHPSSYLQHAWNEHGEMNFVFEELIICHPNMLLFYEQQFIDQWRPKYNMSKVAGNPMIGRKHSEETRHKMSEARKRRPGPNKGKRWSEETKRKISEAMKGKSFTEEHKRKMSEAGMGNKRWLGRKHSKESIKKMSEWQKGIPHGPLPQETKDKLRIVGLARQARERAICPQELR